MAQAGDKEACAALVARYEPLMNNQVSKGMFNLTWDERQAIGRGLVAKAVMTYRPDRGAKFLTWCQCVLKHGVVDQGRMHVRQNRIQAASLTGLDDVVAVDAPFETGGNFYALVSAHLHHPAEQVLLDRLLAGKRPIRLRLEGRYLTPQEIAGYQRRVLEVVLFYLAPRMIAGDLADAA